MGWGGVDSGWVWGCAWGVGSVGAGGGGGEVGGGCGTYLGWSESGLECTVLSWGRLGLRHGLGEVPWLVLLPGGSA